MAEEREQDFTVAIIGGGITGVVLALGFAARSIPFTIYEQGFSISTSGAGLNANPPGLAALRLCSEEAYEAFRSVKAQNWPVDGKDNLYFVITDGENSFELSCDEEFGSMHRVSFIRALAARLPDGCTRFGKRLAGIVRRADGRSILHFEDGSEELADVVVGCDGVKSKVRPLVVGSDHPSAQSGFSHFVVYRGMASKEKACELLGPELTDGAVIHANVGECYASYPVTGNEFLNLGLFLPYPEPWPYLPSLTHKTDKSSLLASMESSGDNFKKLVNLLPDTLDAWAILDTADNPLATYNNGCIAVAGDAAHASTPNLGAGAGQGYEDSAVLVTLLQDIRVASSSSYGDEKAEEGQSPNIHRRIKTALSAYSRTRLERSQWVVKESRTLGNCYNASAYGGKLDMKQLERDVRDRYRILWSGSIEEQVKYARKCVAEELVGISDGCQATGV